MSTPLPDACCDIGPDGHAFLAANKKARRILDEGFGRPRPRWRGIKNTPGNAFKSPQYRVLELQRGPGLCAMLWHLHEAGCTAMYWCGNCDCLHSVDDKVAEAFKYAAVSGAEGVMPAHTTKQ
jgi:hypothetical protein